MFPRTGGGLCWFLLRARLKHSSPVWRIQPPVISCQQPLRKARRNSRRRNKQGDPSVLFGTNARCRTGLLEYRFFDLDVETERFFGTSIERLRNRLLTSHDFRRGISSLEASSLSRGQLQLCHRAPAEWLAGRLRKLSTGRETPPMSCFRILRRISSTGSPFTISTPARCQ
jgi:hypothetical protein